MSRPTILKLGGELLEEVDAMQAIAATIASIARRVPLVVVHGGGREIDAALVESGISKRQVDGIRVTDEATLTVVVRVLAGTINTRLVAAIAAAGGQPVGLTGADANVAPVEAAPPMRTAAGDTVSLGRVGRPVNNGVPHLLHHLLAGRYVPVVASIGADTAGSLYNINADTMAGALAERLWAERLVIAGTSSGVVDHDARTIGELSASVEQKLIESGTANAGMLAKLQACRAALRAGVGSVLIVNGRDPSRLESAVIWGESGDGSLTRVVP
ncbi:MAG: acetylglutamate kinase [Acidobacteria bacterium]|nr:acetylglutamate kinase [Acidobacteriota bacterium]